jgi:hypothetical protein
MLGKRKTIFRKSVKMPPKRTNNVNSDKNSSEKSFYINQYSNAYCNISKDMNLLNKKKSKAKNSVLLFARKKMSQLGSVKTINRKKNNINNNNNNNLKDSKTKFIHPKRNSLYTRTNQLKRKATIKPKKKTFLSLFRGNNFSDYELNELGYKQALEYDHRNFIMYYWSLIRREHIIVHTFFSFDDYNVFSIKLSKFVFSVALDFALNVVFFFDESMRRVNYDYGRFNFIAQFPQSLYSTVISESIDVFLRYLCLTEKEMYRIKQLEKKKKRKDINQKIFKILTCIKIKFFGYFAFSSVLLAFFWYYVSAFCAVYRNTQMILFKDSFISFLLSLLYPFGLYIIPTSLRIIALRAKKKNLQCLYNYSDIIPLI